MLAALAFPAAAPAAEFDLTVLCSAVQESGECAEEDIYPAETAVSATAENLSFSTTLSGEIPVTIICAEATLAGETTGSEETTEQRGELAELAFEGCKEQILGTSCSFESLSLPYSAAVAHDPESPDDGRLAVWEGSGGGPPAVRVKCPLTGFDCLYEAGEEVELDTSEGTIQGAELRVEGGNPGLALAEAVQLTAETPTGGECSGSVQATMEGEFEIAQPIPVLARNTALGIGVPLVTVFKPNEEKEITIQNTSPELTWELQKTTVGAGFSVTETTCEKKVPYKPNELCVMSIKCAQVESFSALNITVSAPALKRIHSLHPALDCPKP